jgi:hypothetical protein
MANLPSHLFVSDSDGALYDTRVPNWFKLAPLRANYCHGMRDIKTVADFKSALRNGQFTFPGCYPLYFIASDGEAISFESAREQFRQIAQTIQDGDRHSGWRIVAVDINYEDADLYCAHSGQRIESAYGEPEDNESDDNDSDD